MSVETKTLSKEISEIFWREGYTLATAESCTAGNVAAIITAIPGSSRFYKGGVIAYSDEVKKTHLYVNAETLEQHGAVSEETVVEMVKGAIKALDVDYAMATSGIAGPGGGSPEKPVGTIWVAAGTKDAVLTAKLTEDEGREKNIRLQRQKPSNYCWNYAKIKEKRSKSSIYWKKICLYKIKSLTLHSV